MVRPMREDTKYGNLCITFNAHHRGSIAEEVYIKLSAWDNLARDVNNITH